MEDDTRRNDRIAFIVSSVSTFSVEMLDAMAADKPSSRMIAADYVTAIRTAMDIIEEMIALTPDESSRVLARADQLHAAAADDVIGYMQKQGYPTDGLHFPLPKSIEPKPPDPDLRERLGG